MTRRRCRAEPPLSPLRAAGDAYRDRFGTPPWTFDIPEDREAAWVAAIRRAVREGRELTDADLERVAGIRVPPGGFA